MWCVLNIKIAPTGTVMVDVYWSARRAGTLMYVSVPPEAPAVIYLADNLGDKYDSIKAGGCALTSKSVKSGDGCSGWLVYPSFKPGVSSVSVFYDKYQLVIADIPLLGQVVAVTSTPTPNP